MKKPQYFNIDDFVDSVIAELHVGDQQGPALDELRLTIAQQLRQRLVMKIFQELDREHFTMFERLLKDHPELGELDALMMMLPNIEGMREKLVDTVNILHEELATEARAVYTAKMSLMP